MQTPPVPFGWNARLLDQLTFHWETLLRPELDGLTDEEYFWEPVPGVWNLVPRGRERTEGAHGGGDLVIEWDHPAPARGVATTIAWQLSHVITGVFGERNHKHFEGPVEQANVLAHTHAPTARQALADLDDAYDWWVEGVTSLREAGLENAVGASEGVFAQHPYAGLVLHVHREVIHHGAEILLLRRLHRLGA